jgi:hypothetical protein
VLSIAFVTAKPGTGQNTPAMWLAIAAKLTSLAELADATR